MPSPMNARVFSASSVEVKPPGFGAKASTDVTYWPVALRHGVELRSRCRVREITLDENGMADGVIRLFIQDNLLKSIVDPETQVQAKKCLTFYHG